MPEEVSASQVAEVCMKCLGDTPANPGATTRMKKGPTVYTEGPFTTSAGLLGEAFAHDLEHVAGQLTRITDAHQFGFHQRLTGAVVFTPAGQRC